MKIALTNSARALRQSHTDAERKLWGGLRDRRLAGFKFKRQAPRGPYVVDFLSVEAGLVVEVDGSQHAGAQAKCDQVRTRFLEKEGFQVLRYWNNEVLGSIEGVLGSIRDSLPEPPAPSPDAARHPLPEGRGEKGRRAEEQAK